MPIEAKESIRWLDNLRSLLPCSMHWRAASISATGEADIYELLCLAHHLGTHFLVRTCVDRLLAGDGGHTIADEMEEVRVKGKHRAEVRDRRGNVSTAVFEIRFKRALSCRQSASKRGIPS